MLQEIKEKFIEYNSEADIHFDFYYILNKENKEFFWKKRSIECFGYEERIRGKPDIIIYDPEREDESVIRLIAEIKYDSPDGKTTKRDGKRVHPIKIDLDKLLQLKNITHLI